MKMRHWVAALAVLGMVGFTVAPAMAGPGCGSKAKASCSASKSSCGAKTTTAGNDACCPGGKSAMKACNNTAEQCSEWMQKNYQTHGWLGIEMSLDGANPIVTEVVSNSPAHAAGFQKGDELTTVNGISFTDQAAIQQMMTNGFKIGDSVVYTAKRGSEIVQLNAQLARISAPALERMIAIHTQTYEHKSSDKAENMN